jgi:hypothetical protein
MVTGDCARRETAANNNRKRSLRIELAANYANDANSVISVIGGLFTGVVYGNATVFSAMLFPVCTRITAN